MCRAHTLMNLFWVIEAIAHSRHTYIINSKLYVSNVTQSWSALFFSSPSVAKHDSLFFQFMMWNETENLDTLHSTQKTYQYQWSGWLMPPKRITNKNTYNNKTTSLWYHHIAFLPNFYFIFIFNESVSVSFCLSITGNISNEAWVWNCWWANKVNLQCAERRSRITINIEDAA